MTFLVKISTNSNILSPKSENRKRPKPEITAELSGSSSCVCKSLGVSMSGNAPVLAMCRELLAARADPDSSLTVYRKGILSLRIRSIREGARLTVKEPDRGRPHFARWSAFAPSPVAPLVRENGGGRP
jgi:hypothetical protein